MLEIIAKINFWVTIVVGLTIIGEATALLIGMNLPHPNASEWSTIKNNGLALLDVITGVILLYLLFNKDSSAFRPVSYLVLMIMILTHGLREWEYIVSYPNRFCTNMPLFIVNNLKLFGSVVISIISTLK